MSKLNLNISAFIACTLLLVACNTNTKSKVNPDSVLVFSAASLTNVLNEIADSFENHYNIKVKTNLASSGTLARQIEQSASPDIYISANKKWATYIDSLGYFIEGKSAVLALNQLVLISPARSTLKPVKVDSSLNLKKLLNGARLAIGNPEHVPAGQYAKQALQYFGWYNNILPNVLPTKDVRTALMFVELEEAQLGIVYRTDALKSGKVKIIGSFPSHSHKAIEYMAGICNSSANALKFYEYLNNEATKEIWDKHGFK